MSNVDFEKFLKERVGEACGACLPRHKGFAENGPSGPARYRDGARP
jgi:hypothetical protein